MSVAEFLSELRRRDVEVAIDGDELRCSARAGALTPELRDRLKERKTGSSRARARRSASWRCSAVRIRPSSGRSGALGTGSAPTPASSSRARRAARSLTLPRGCGSASSGATTLSLRFGSRSSARRSLRCAATRRAISPVACACSCRRTRGPAPASGRRSGGASREPARNIRAPMAAAPTTSSSSRTPAPSRPCFGSAGVKASRLKARQATGPPGKRRRFTPCASGPLAL